MAVTHRSAEGQVEVAVTDSGPGLGSDQLERVSGRFYSESGSATSGSSVTLKRPMTVAPVGVAACE